MERDAIFTAIQKGGPQVTQMTAIVRDGKIEVTAPRDLSEGTEVTLLIVRNGTIVDRDSTEDTQDSYRALLAMDRFEDAFPVDENGEDLSRAARESSDWEKANFEANAEKLRRTVD